MSLMDELAMTDPEIAKELDHELSRQRNKLELIPTIAEADVDLVFDPPWGRHMMSEAAKLETGML